MSVETVARRYATALADVVTKTGETENVRGELQQWEAMMKANAELMSAFRNPSIQQNQKEKVLNSLLQKAKPAQTTANFFARFASQRSPDRNFRDQSEIFERSGRTTGRRFGKNHLGASAFRNGKTGIKSKFGENDRQARQPEFEIDNSIIGGVVTTIGSTVYDGSVKTQLQTLKEQ